MGIPCKTCDSENLGIKDFYKQSQNSNGLHTSCKECCRLRDRERRMKAGSRIIPKTLEIVVGSVTLTDCCSWVLPNQIAIPNTYAGSLDYAEDHSAIIAQSWSNTHE